MKVTITSAKPRNPLVAPARLRLAGRHDSQDKAHRQRGRNELRRELKLADHDRHSP
ncbi:hypothetical protein AACH06_14625 [Ideonella sp. DXS29W]|uniref:Uncharacterized protein n=1 Tax=Ideonella lacteola TaxID=2984193 RepID=A0ABU9BRG7_9BURK